MVISTHVFAQTDSEVSFNVFCSLHVCNTNLPAKLILTGMLITGDSTWESVNPTENT